jgi:SPP1 gp7 family putative phage head morphogenesis protein
MNFEDVSLTEESLFSLYKSKGYNDTRISLELALEKINGRIANLSDTVTRRQLQELKKLIEDEITAAYGGLFEAIKEESVAASYAVNAPYLLEFTTAKVPTETIDYILNSKRDILGYGFEELFKLTEENHARALRTVLASGVAQGLGTKELIETMNIKNESLTNSQLYSSVHTAIKSARSETTYATYKQLEKLDVIKGYEFSATLDGKTSEICRNLDKTKWMTTIDKVPSKPPLHFRCRSTLKPISTNEYKSGKRASMDGEIEYKSYGEWFATKDEAFQLKTLGRLKYDAYKKGIYKVNGVEDLRPKNSLSMGEIETLL